MIITRHSRLAARCTLLLLLTLSVGGLSGCTPIIGAKPGEGFNPLAIEFLEIDQHHAGGTTGDNPTATRIAQSFRVAQPNLNQFAIQLTAIPTLDQGGTFHLKRGDGMDGPDVVTIPLTATNFDSNPYIAFRFGPLPDSAGQLYTAIIESNGPPLGPLVAASVSPLDEYTEGRAYIDGQPQPNDFAFRTSYIYTPLNLLGDTLGGLLGNVGFALTLLALLWLPGGALLQWSVVSGQWSVTRGQGAGIRGQGSEVNEPQANIEASELATTQPAQLSPQLPPLSPQSSVLSPGQRLLAAPGVSLLAWPVFLLGAHLVRLPISSAVVWGGIGVAGLLLALGIGVERRQAQMRRMLPPPDAPPYQPAQPATRNSQRAWDALFWGTLVAVVALTLLNRLGMMRTLVAGIGIDAYHHTLISAMFLQNGGIPDNYEPYAPLASFTYHFGFHSFVAALAWLKGGNPDDTLMLMPFAGQILSTLPVLTFTLFGWRVLGQRWIGLIAGTIAGLICVFPMFYVNWSRFPQLAGIALVPVAWVLLFEALAPLRRPDRGGTPERAGLPWNVADLRRTVQGQAPWIILTIITTAGLFFTHYRIVAMFATYAVGYVGWVLLRGLWRARRARQAGAADDGGLRWVFTAGSVAVVGPALVIFPWLLNLRANFVVRFAGSSDPENAAYYDQIKDLISGTAGHYWSTNALLGLAALGFVWAVLRLNWPVVLLGLWTGLHLLLGNPVALHLPGSGYVDINTVAQSLFLPVSLLAGFWILDFGSWIIQRIPKPVQSAIRNPQSALVLVVLGLLVGVYGALRALPELDVKPYVAPQDIAVLRWLRANSPADAYVLGNGFGWPWGPAAVQGSDAGLWAPLIAGRRSTLPLMPAYNERLADPDYLSRAIHIVQTSHATAPDDPANWAFLRSVGVTYIFVGSRGGTLDPSVFLAHPEQVTLVQHVDDAWLFMLK